MTLLGKSPFDDASGQEFLEWFGAKGGFPARVLAGITLAGTTIADAVQLSAGLSFVETALANEGGLLPDVGIGEAVPVVNGTANTIKVYPPTATQNISYGSDGAAVSLTTHTGALFIRVSQTRWVRIAIV